MQFHRVPELLVGHSLVDGSQFGFILAVISVLRLHSSLQLSFQRQEINHIPLRHSHSWRGPRGAETADPRWAEDRKLKLTGGSNNTCYFETQIKNLDYWSNMVVFWWKCSFFGTVVSRKEPEICLFSDRLWPRIRVSVHLELINAHCLIDHKTGGFLNQQSLVLHDNYHSHSQSWCSFPYLPKKRAVRERSCAAGANSGVCNKVDLVQLTFGCKYRLDAARVPPTSSFLFRNYFYLPIVAMTTNRYRSVLWEIWGSSLTHYRHLLE